MRWRPVVGFEGLYEVSDLGTVRSLDRQVTRSDGVVRNMPGKVLRSGNGDGRPTVQLCGPGGRTRSAHTYVLMLEAFVGPRPPGQHACHYDDNPQHNKLSNLRWDTPSSNQLDRVRNGKHHNANKTHCKWGHELVPPNLIPSPSRPNVRNCRMCNTRRNRTHDTSYSTDGTGVIYQ